MKYTIEEVDHTNVIFEFEDMPQMELLKEAILYIADKSQNSPAFGATKVNKYLYYADLISFARHGEPITGSPYQHLPNGPAPVKLMQARQALIDAAAVKVEERLYFTRKQSRLVPLKAYQVERLKQRDRELLDEVMEALGNANASEVSTASHGMAWMTTEDGELIPYNSVFLSDDPITADDIHQFFKDSRMSQREPLRFQEAIPA